MFKLLNLFISSSLVLYFSLCNQTFSMDYREDPPIEMLRHSTAHLMAAAIQNIYPGVMFGVGPAISNGFYYDIKVPDRSLKEIDLEVISNEMKKLKNMSLPFIRVEIPIDEAISLMQSQGQIYKVDLLNLLKTQGSTMILKEVDDTNLFNSEHNSTISSVSMYKIGDIFIDLCKGPHVENTREVGVFKLNQISAAYWRGNSKNDTLQRIYALCYADIKALKAEEVRLEEIKQRDHRTLGAQHKLFFFSSEEVGVGLPFWKPNGAIIRKELEFLATEYERRQGYQGVITPELAKEALYYQSGHLPYYKEDMYNPIDIEGVNYILRPMNCPHHHMVYLNEKRSYRDLPLKLSEYGKVYRFEPSGSLTGLMRTRGFSQNDAHIYCQYDQAKDVFVEVMKLHETYYKLLGIKDFYMRLSLPDISELEAMEKLSKSDEVSHQTHESNEVETSSKYVKNPGKWLEAVKIVRMAMEESGLPYKEVEGEAAFYGPKIDFQILNALGNEFSISTNQLDFYASERFNLFYSGEDGRDHPVYVIHRAPLGSHERFVAFLTEHYKATFPTWLSPQQVRILTINNEFDGYAKQVCQFLFNSPIKTATGGIRVEFDNSDETLGKKIKMGQQDRVPYVLVIGKREQETGTVTMRLRNGDQAPMKVDEFLKRIKYEIENRLDFSFQKVVDYGEQIPIDFEEFLRKII